MYPLCPGELWIRCFVNSLGYPSGKPPSLKRHKEGGTDNHGYTEGSDSAIEVYRAY